MKAFDRNQNVLEAYEQHTKQYELGSRKAIPAGNARLCRIQEEQKFDSQSSGEEYTYHE